MRISVAIAGPFRGDKLAQSDCPIDLEAENVLSYDDVTLKVRDMIQS
jgi:hypothetical protein